MSKRAASTRATLDAWREQGAERRDPLRFRFLEALEKRAAGLDGEARRLLDERLAAQIAAYAGELKARPVAADPVPAEGTLRALIDAVNDNAARRAPAFPELPLLQEFRQLWSHLRTESHVRQSLEQVPENAGPLNSSTLVHRSIALMRELSPGYLGQFLSYIDALSWIEQIPVNGASKAAGKDGTRTPGTRRRSRDKSRSQDE